MTPTDLRSVLESELLSSGVLDDVTAHFRHLLIQQLAPSDDSSPLSAERLKLNLTDIATRSLVLDYLQAEHLDKTASVFVPDAGLSNRMLSPDDAMRALGLDPLPPGSSTSSARSALATLLQSSACSSLASASSATPPQLLKASTQTTPASIDKENGDRSHNNAFAEFSRDVENRLRREMEADMSAFKNERLEELRLEEAAKQQDANERFRSDLRSQYNARLEEVDRNEKERMERLAEQEKQAELVLYNKRQDLIRQTESYKKHEEEGRRELASRNEQLQLQEQRVEQMLAAANARMESVEEKERELRERVQEEYEKARASAKKAYEDATTANQSQGELLEKELHALNGQRNLLAKRHNDALAREAEVALLRSRNEELSSALIESKKCLEENGRDHKDLLCAREEELMKLQNEVLARRRVEAEQKLDYQQRLRAYEEDNARAKRTADVASSGRDDALKEVEELRKLLARSQSALASLNPAAITARSNSLTERVLRLERARKSAEQTTGTPPPAACRRPAESQRPSPGNTPVQAKVVLGTKLAKADTAASRGKAELPERSTPPKDASVLPKDPSTAPRQDPPTGSTPGALPPNGDALPMTTRSDVLRDGDISTPTGIQVNIRPALSFVASPVGSALTDVDVFAPLTRTGAAGAAVSRGSPGQGVGDGQMEQSATGSINDNGHKDASPSGPTPTSTGIQFSKGDHEVNKQHSSVDGDNMETDKEETEEKEIVTSLIGASQAAIKEKDDEPSTTPDSPSDCYTSFDHEGDDDNDEKSAGGGSTEETGSKENAITGNATDSSRGDALPAVEDTFTVGENSTAGTTVYQSDFETIVSASTVPAEKN